MEWRNAGKDSSNVDSKPSAIGDSGMWSNPICDTPDAEEHISDSPRIEKHVATTGFIKKGSIADGEMDEAKERAVLDSIVYSFHII